MARQDEKEEREGLIVQQRHPSHVIRLGFLSYDLDLTFLPSSPLLSSDGCSDEESMDLTHTSPCTRLGIILSGPQPKLGSIHSHSCRPAESGKDGVAGLERS